MTNLTMTIEHRLEPAEAARRITNIIGEVKTRFAGKISNLREEWDGDTGKFSFSFMGFPVSGTLTVTPKEVNISGTLPSAAMLFKKNIESTLRDHAARLLA